MIGLFLAERRLISLRRFPHRKASNWKGLWNVNGTAADTPGMREAHGITVAKVNFFVADNLLLVLLEGA